jgi:hypothetical protein
MQIAEPFEDLIEYYLGLEVVDACFLVKIDSGV